jgi:chromosome segregation ATPase
VQLAELQERTRHLQENTEKLNGSVGKLTEEISQARQTANLATKLQMLREADLNDLQARYKEAVNTQEQQHQLMLQLEEKLRLASQYFHQLKGSEVSSVEIAPESISHLKPPPRRSVAKKRVGK